MNMKKILSVAVIAMLLLVSCATSVSLSYQKPSNVNMSQYRSVAVASASPFKSSQRIPLFLRFDITDPTISTYMIFSTFDYDKVNDSCAKELTQMVNKVFSRSSYYSVLSPEKTDTYLSFYKIGKNPSELLKAEGVDALIVPKITRFYNDEFVTADTYEKDGTKYTTYYIHRSIDLGVTISVLDTATDRIIAMKEYSSTKNYVEVYDPEFPLIFRYSQSDAISDTISDMVSQMVADFVPTSGRANVELLANSPKNERAKEAYDAVKDGSYAYAYTLFNDIWNSEGHIPSGYNAALLIAVSGDLDGALRYLSAMQTRVSDRDVNRLYATLSSIKESNDKALAQYSPTTTVTETTSLSPYDFLLN